MRICVFAICLLCPFACFLRLPVSAKESALILAEASRWVDEQPLATTYETVPDLPSSPTDRSARLLQLSPENLQRFRIRMARNYALAELQLGRPVTGQSSGSGEITRSQGVLHERFFERVQMGAEFVSEVRFALPLRNLANREAGAETKEEEMHMSLPFAISLDARKTYSGSGFFLQALGDERPIGYNHPLFPNFLPRPVAAGREWQIAGRYRRSFRTTTPVPPYWSSSDARIIVLQFYRFLGVTLWKKRRCALVVTRTEEFETQQIANEEKNSVTVLSDRDLLRLSPHEIADVLRDRGSGAFQVSSRSDGLLVFDIDSGIVVLHRFERRALTAGGSVYFAPTAQQENSNYGKGVSRERWLYVADNL